MGSDTEADHAGGNDPHLDLRARSGERPMSGAAARGPARIEGEGGRVDGGDLGDGSTAPKGTRVAGQATRDGEDCECGGRACGDRGDGALAQGASRVAGGGARDDGGDLDSGDRDGGDGVRAAMAEATEPDRIVFDVYRRDCASHELLKLLANRWAVLVVSALAMGAMRHSELARKVEGATPKMLTQALRRLERDGLVSRHVTASSPPRVDYALTPLGRELASRVRGICRWSESFVPRVLVARARAEGRVLSEETWRELAGLDRADGGAAPAGRWSGGRRGRRASRPAHAPLG